MLPSELLVGFSIPGHMYVYFPDIIDTIDVTNILIVGLFSSIFSALWVFCKHLPQRESFYMRMYEVSCDL